MIVCNFFFEWYWEKGFLFGFCNLLGVWVMDLWDGLVDMFYWIYGINKLLFIGRSVLLGCICMWQQDVIDFFDWVFFCIKVIVLIEEQVVKMQ